jgi:hypothetical protein
VFDFRYHVASLAAVFLALVIGMLVGAGIAGRGLLDEAERDNLNAEIAAREAELADARLHSGELEAAGDVLANGYDALLAGRLEDRRVAVLFVGSVDPDVRAAVQETVELGGGRIVRLDALRMPLASNAVDGELQRRSELEGYVGVERLGDLGRDLGREFVEGGETPLWAALDGVLVEERRSVSNEPADAVVVCRTALPQQGDGARFLRGLYSGIAGGGEPAVGVETSTAVLSAVEIYRRHGLSSVDNVELPVGRVVLAVLLAGGSPGHYGIKETATATVPPIDPVPPPSDEG